MVPPVESVPGLTAGAYGLTDGAGVTVLRAAGASGVVPLPPQLPYTHESLGCERNDSDNDRGKEGGVFVIFLHSFSVVAFSRVSEGVRVSQKKDFFVSLHLQSRALPHGGDRGGANEAKGEVRSSERG